MPQNAQPQILLGWIAPGLPEAIDRLGQNIVVAVAYTANRGLDLMNSTLIVDERDHCSNGRSKLRLSISPLATTMIFDSGDGDVACTE